MKNNWNKIKLGKWMAFALVPLLLIACGKKDGGSGGGGGYTIGGVYDSCGGCSGTGILLDQISTSGPMVSSNGLAIVAQGGGYGMSTYNDKVITQYSGGATLEGTVNITRNDYYFCYAPAGTYQLQPMNVGQSTMGAISGMNIRLVNLNGGNVITLRNVSGQVYNNQDPYGTRLGSSSNKIGLSFTIESVDGRYCNGWGTTY